MWTTRIVPAASRSSRTGTVPIRLENPEWDNLDNSAFEEWSITLPVPKEQAEKLLERLLGLAGEDVVGPRLFEHVDRMAGGGRPADDDLERAFDEEPRVSEVERRDVRPVSRAAAGRRLEVHEPPA